MNWLLALIKAIVGVFLRAKAEEQQDIGKTKQVNADLTAALKLSREQVKALENEQSLEDSLSTGKF